MKIVADENIPLLDAFFASFGDIIRLPGRAITAEHVREADMLLVRSITQVNAELLQDSAVRFVGTATIGTDHIDEQFLTAKGIGFASAPGCNANAVVEYVLSALNVLAEQQDFDIRDKVVGIVGKGNVGGTLHQVLQRLGVATCVSDPFLEESEPHAAYVDLPTLIAESDIISLHTPLTDSGPHPTHHLFNEQVLRQLKPGTILINASRGAVIDNEALLKLKSDGLATTVVLDVWEGEPEINTALLPYIELATPHIAGYSLDGKMQGTEMIYKGACRFFGLPTRIKLPGISPMPVMKSISFAGNVPRQQAVSTAIRSLYDIRCDDVILRRELLKSGAEVGKIFDGLRKNYRERREFKTLKIKLKNCPGDVVNAFKALGFKVVIH
ncbi:4-phosphoerythronate dehydrogenase PdxB [Zooshikella harenae]|uniref:Erythronate-4-phosphate dehydrogenase n=1 Tax=Zooshikella harenae TaxID=2827238 RepID=A0ABS5ZDQ7_9GAMM|nr:4-phosphoerythronate dehydrogenase PdxB [Zooshikella harenae]MBU2712194.1 4-phosphoerythronate dehydrogenase PdxB [Zooshikella harenae]